MESHAEAQAFLSELAPLLQQSEEKEAEKEKKTSPYMTKYEWTKIIGMRAEAIGRGEPPLIKLKHAKMTHAEIALHELIQKKLVHVLVRRHLNDSEYEDWYVNDLLLPLDEVDALHPETRLLHPVTSTH